MKNKTLLRLAAVISLIQGLGHLLLMILAKPRTSPEIGFVELMKSSYFDMGGLAQHSYWQLYFGYGILAALNSMSLGILLLLSAGQDVQYGMAKRLALFVILYDMVHVSLVAYYFSLILPMAFDTLVIAILVVFYWRTRHVAKESLA